MYADWCAERSPVLCTFNSGPENFSMLRIDHDDVRQYNDEHFDSYEAQAGEI